MTRDYSEQEQFWAGDFGDEYTGRNAGAMLIASNIALFTKILCHTQKIESIIEFGANRGLNLIALRALLPAAKLSAVEINKTAVAALETLNLERIYPQSILDYNDPTLRDLVLDKGVLIHIAPELLPQVYEIYYRSSKRYICLCEYYNPIPVEVTYRGHQNRLFKRDFAGEMLDKHPDLRLVDYGFVYHRDNNNPQDDVNWFLLEKSK